MIFMQNKTCNSSRVMYIRNSLVHRLRGKLKVVSFEEPCLHFFLDGRQQAA